MKCIFSISCHKGMRFVLYLQIISANPSFSSANASRGIMQTYYLLQKR